MSVLQYSLAVVSKVPLGESDDLSQSAYLLGQEIAQQGQILLTPVGLDLGYRVAAGASSKTGLSIGFSPAHNMRQHVSSLRMPTDVYDWLYYSGQEDVSLLTEMVRSCQAVLFVGGVLDNIAELSQAIERFLPIGILLDTVNESNNDILNYLQALPAERQRQIILHQDPKVLVQTICRMLQSAYADLDTKTIKAGNQLFQDIVERGDKPADKSRLAEA